MYDQLDPTEQNPLPDDGNIDDRHYGGKLTHLASPIAKLEYMSQSCAV